jgi:hypothetical protein
VLWVKLPLAALPKNFRSHTYHKLYKQSNAAQPDGSVVGNASNSFPYFTAISKKNLA